MVFQFCFTKFLRTRFNTFLFDSFNEAINSRELSTTQKRGISSLMHKGGNKNDLND